MFTYLGAMGLGGEVSPTRVTTTGVVGNLGGLGLAGWTFEAYGGGT